MRRKVITARRLAGGIGLCVGALAVWSAAAQAPAACVAPQPPQRVEMQALDKPVLPAKPACADKNRCRQTDVNAYNAKIEAYNGRVFTHQEAYGKAMADANAYIARLNAYSADVDVYKNCERRRLMRLMGDAD